MTYLVVAVDPDFDGKRFIEVEAESERVALEKFAQRYPDAIVRSIVLI